MPGDNIIVLDSQFNLTKHSVYPRQAFTDDWQLWRMAPSTACTSPSYLYSHVSPEFPTRHPDDGCGLLPHIFYLRQRLVYSAPATFLCDSVTLIFATIIIITISYRRSARSSLYSRQAGVSGFLVPPSGTTCLSTSHLRRHSRFSDNDSRLYWFPVTTNTLSYDSCVTIAIHHYCLDICGFCNK